MDIDHRDISAGSLATYVIAIAISAGTVATGLGFLVRIGWETAGSLFR